MDCVMLNSQAGYCNRLNYRQFYAKNIARIKNLTALACSDADTRHTPLLLRSRKSLDFWLKAGLERGG